MVRGTLRPLPQSPSSAGLRVTGFYDADAYVKNGDRRRGIVAVTFEHPHLNAAFEYLQTTDQTRAKPAKVKSKGGRSGQRRRRRTTWAGKDCFASITSSQTRTWMANTHRASSWASPTGSRIRATVIYGAAVRLRERRTTTTSHRRDPTNGATRCTRCEFLTLGRQTLFWRINGMKLWKHATLAAGAVLLAGATLGAQAIINGAGATFPNPIYQKWFAEYNKLHSDVRINYQPVGSGGGIQQVSKRTVFFGATDAADDRRAVAGRGRQAPALPHRARRGRADLQRARSQCRAEVHRARSSRTSSSARSRSGTTRRIAKANDGVTAARTPTSSSCTGRKGPARPTSSRTSSRRSRPSGRARSGVNAQLELAGRHRRQGQRRRHRAGEADARRDWLHRADLRADEQDRLRLGRRIAPASSSRRVDRVGQRSRGGRRGARCRLISGCPSPTPTATRPIRSPRSPGCSSTRTRRTRRRRRRWWSS